MSAHAAMPAAASVPPVPAPPASVGPTVSDPSSRRHLRSRSGNRQKRQQKVVDGPNTEYPEDEQKVTYVKYVPRSAATPPWDEEPQSAVGSERPPQPPTVPNKRPKSGPTQTGFRDQEAKNASLLSGANPNTVESRLNRPVSARLQALLDAPLLPATQQLRTAEQHALIYARLPPSPRMSYISNSNQAQQQKQQVQQWPEARAPSPRISGTARPSSSPVDTEYDRRISEEAAREREEARMARQSARRQAEQQQNGGFSATVPVDTFVDDSEAETSDEEDITGPFSATATILSSLSGESRAEQARSDARYRRAVESKQHDLESDSTSTEDRTSRAESKAGRSSTEGSRESSPRRHSGVSHPYPVDPSSMKLSHRLILERLYKPGSATGVRTHREEAKEHSWQPPHSPRSNNSSRAGKRVVAKFVRLDDATVAKPVSPKDKRNRNTFSPRSIVPAFAVGTVSNPSRPATSGAFSAAAEAARLDSMMTNPSLLAAARISAAAGSARVRKTAHPMNKGGGAADLETVIIPVVKGPAATAAEKDSSKAKLLSATGVVTAEAANPRAMQTNNSTRLSAGQSICLSASAPDSARSAGAPPDWSYLTSQRQSRNKHLATYQDAISRREKCLEGRDAALGKEVAAKERERVAQQKMEEEEDQEGEKIPLYQRGGTALPSKKK
jgi:hypothetical protein